MDGAVALVIAVVVHTSRRALFEEAASTLSGVSLKWVIYEREDDIRRQVADLLAGGQVDGLLLGSVPYAACRDLLPIDLSVAVIRSAALDLALTLYRAVAKGWEPTPVSIDTFDTEIVDEVARALDLDRDRIACLPYSREQSSEEIAEFHLRFHRESGENSYVISARSAVARQLNGTVPLLNGMPVPSTIRTELHELALRIESSRASALRFAAGIFSLSKQDGRTDVERARVGLMNLLVNTPEFAEAWIENRDRNGVFVFAHKALFERITHNWVTVPALAEAESTLGIQVAAGFGVGASARNCVLLAERAALRAEREDSPAGYLIEDNGLIIGPMTPARAPLEFSYRGHREGLEDLAGNVGLSATTLSRLAALEHTLDGRPISPGDLAESLGITDPSGRRLIRKLSACGLVTAEGSAQNHAKGRPSRLYRLRIDHALKGTP
jgi:DNA-binding transcriptional ArsR family regulator